MDASVKNGGPKGAHRKKVAWITDTCTGCSGAPVCQVFCKYDALKLVSDAENYPFRKVQVDPERCMGCGHCVSRGSAGICLLGCPWDAIRLVAD